MLVKIYFLSFFHCKNTSTNVCIITANCKFLDKILPLTLTCGFCFNCPFVLLLFMLYNLENFDLIQFEKKKLFFIRRVFFCNRYVCIMYLRPTKLLILITSTYNWLQINKLNYTLKRLVYSCFFFLFLSFHEIQTSMLVTAHVHYNIIPSIVTSQRESIN